MKAGRNRGLSEQEKAALAGLVGRRDPATLSPQRVVPAAPRYDAELLPFESLPSYREMNLQRQMGELLGLESPFFRVHDVRAGATTVIDGVVQDNFSSYDYLGLNGDARVMAAAETAIRTFGTSSSASRLVAGERPLHRDLEAAIARHYGAEASLVLVSGHATNVSAIGTLIGPRDLILHDALIHNSVIMGAQLAGAERRVFPHNDLDALEEMLTRNRSRYERTLIVVEGLYSMDGDFPDLPRLIEIKRRHGAWLMVDEAHSLGVLGSRGRGIFEHYGIDSRDVDIWMGTLSKTLASCGGYIAGSGTLIEYLKFAAAGFVYSVGLSPPLAAAAIQSLDVLEQEPERVDRLRRNGALFLESARAVGLDTGFSTGLSVIPVIVGDSILAIALSQCLSRAGINVQPIIHPAVPERSSRLRFFITSEHSPEQIVRAVDVTKRELDRLGSSKAILSRPELLKE